MKALEERGPKSRRDFDPKPGVARNEQPRVPVRPRFNLEEVVAEGAWISNQGVVMRWEWPQLRWS